MKRGAFATLALGLALSDATAQHVLDANPSALHGNRNPTSAPLVVGPEIYSVHRGTGTMVFNRATAFNDSTYSIHQRSAFHLFDSQETSGVFSAAMLARTPAPEAAPLTGITGRAPSPVGAAPRRLPAGPDPLTPAGRITFNPMDRFVTPVASGPVMRGPDPLAPPRPAPALTGPAYSVANRPLRMPGSESSRVRTYSVFGG